MSPLTAIFWISLLSTTIVLTRSYWPRVQAWLRARGVSTATTDRLAEIGRIALAVVMRLETTVVAERKNPETPSAWDAAAKREVKAMAVAEVTALAQAKLAALAQQGTPAAELEAIVSNSIEAAVRGQPKS